ncbi:MAG TPA: IncP-type conjugal transfer protein TraG, partial [Reyranella sp.]
VPTLLTWPGSSIVHDIKGENWELTSGFRSRHGRVLLFDPTNAASAAYNPLLEVRRGEWEVRDVQNIADVLVDPEGALERRNHWEKTSHALLVGAILHVLYAGEDKTLAGVAAFLSDPKQPIETTLRAMMTTTHLGEAGVHPVIASAARELLNKSENERSGVLSTAMSFLGLYRDPVVAQVTRRCDWRIRDLVESERPTTLYLVVPPSDISRTKPLVRLVLNQIGRRLTEELHAKGRRHRLLLMLDEFPALGRLDFFESALAFMAGYGLKSFLIAQSLNQIEKAYGPNNAILDNCHVRVCFATNDERTAKRVSDALGTATEIRDARNYAGHRLSPWLGHLMVSRQETARPLLTPGEVMQLPATDELVLVSGCPPIRARKARYYEDRQLTERLLPPPKSERPRTSSVTLDDWSAAPVPSAPTASGEAENGLQEAQPIDDPANGGIRREPELAEHEDIAPEPVTPSPEFEFAEDEADEDAMRARRLRATSRGLARQAAMDPGDGIDL